MYRVVMNPGDLGQDNIGEICIVHHEKVHGASKRKEVRPDARFK